MAKTLRFYRSKWVGGFLLVLMVCFIILSVIFFIYKEYIYGSLFLLVILMTIPRWKDEFNFKKEIVTITDDMLLISTKKFQKSFDLAEIKYVEFTSGKSIFNETEYLLIHYHTIKEPEKVYLPDLNVSRDDLVWVINEKAKRCFRLYED